VNIFNRINKKERIEQWIEWVEIPVEIRQPNWGEHIPRGWFDPKRNVIVINGKQDEKEIIRSIIHEVCHWINSDRSDDPDIWERESRCQRVESQWKVEPDNVVWE
jgi:hypothetical protein